jgi:Domain of unknown function (DUF1963)
MRPTDEIVAVLRPAIEEAVFAAVQDAQVERPFVVELRLGDEGFPPFVRVGGDAFRERMTSISPEGNGAVRLLYQAKPPLGATVELTDYLDDDAMAACREMNWARSYERGREHPDRQRGREIAKRLGREWALHLNQRDWPGAADPFLVLVRVGREYDDADAFELALPAVGRERIDAFEASIRSRAERRDLPAEARTDAGALQAELAARGLVEDAARIAAEAKLSLRLRPAEGDVATRIGGRGLLPPGESWPHAAGDRPLTFLAGVDLAELPQPTPLPGAGWLLFYADIDNDEALGLIEPVDYELGERLGLDPAAASVVEEIAARLRYDDDADIRYGEHRILGALSGVQGHPTDPGTVLLLHLAYDESLGFEFLDGGAIQFRIPEDALARGDWSAVAIEPDSA